MNDPTPHHGIDLFLPAAYSKNSLGIGEYLDLIPIIYWCKKVGFDLIQLLPLNDSGADPSPYNILSSVALNPVYLRLDALTGPRLPSSLSTQLKKLHKKLHPKESPYSTVLQEKLLWLQEYYIATMPYWSHNKEYLQFRADHPWLNTYALFKTLKSTCGDHPWETWAPMYRNPNSSIKQALFREFEECISFYALCQYLCFVQLEEVHRIARQENLLLKGDLPILVSRDSADVWSAPHLFDLTKAAGAPPDAYSVKGQYWGFPPPNWCAIEKEGYQFWKQRLEVASLFYDIYRLDHAVGFYRIWGILLGKDSENGAYIPKDPKEWIPQGEKILRTLLSSSTMQPIAEDLGIIPQEVRTSLEELGIPGVKILRWERFYDTTGAYIPYEEYPVLSLSSVSTHDSSTLGGWWIEDEEGARAFCAFKEWTYIPHLAYNQRLSILKDVHSTSSRFHVNLLQEYFALFPDLVALTPSEERINIPGEFSTKNWSYRYKNSMETWMSHQPLIEAISQILP